MKFIITIGREYGSGGRFIGELLAKKLNISFYDENLLTKASEESGLSEFVFKSYDEKKDAFFVNGAGLYSYDMSLGQKVFLAQFETIKNIAKNESCVIVGRCADYALADYQNVLNVFIYGDEESKVKRIMSHNEGISAKEAKDMMVKKHKQRQSYYNYYSSKKWGRADSYDLCINSSKLGVEGTKKLIIQAIEDFENCR